MSVKVFLLLLYHIPLMYFQNSGPAVWLWVGTEVDLEQDSCQQQGVTGFGKQGGKSGVCAHIHISFCVVGDKGERTAVLTQVKGKNPDKSIFCHQTTCNKGPLLRTGEQLDSTFH